MNGALPQALGTVVFSGSSSHPDVLPYKNLPFVKLLGAFSLTKVHPRKSLRTKAGLDG